jgi:micro-tubular organiser Mto1-like protein with Mto2-binding region
LESSGLETKRLTEALDKERQARRADRSAWDLMQRNQQSLTRTIQQNDSRVSEVESARQSDRRRFAQIEQSLKEQLAERNSLLNSLWNRLTTICGADFLQRHGLADLSLGSDSMAKNWSQFARSMSLAAKTIESILGSFKSQIRELEKSQHKEFQNLERALEIRSKRIDHIENTLRNQRQQASSYDQTESQRSASRASSAREEHYARLKSENKLLKAEVQMFRTTTSANGGPSPVPERGSSHRGRRESSLMRHYSASVVEGHHGAAAVSPTRSGGGSLGRRDSPVAVDPTVTVPTAHPSHIPILTAADSPTANGRRTSSSHHNRQTSGASGASGGANMQPSEQRWVHRLKELERRLKAEREARLLDRSGARKRIEESEAEKESLRLQLEREIERRVSLEEERMVLDQGMGDEE